MKKLIAIIGDVHAHVAAAKLGLEAIESETGRSLDLVLSVGDFGLFLNPEDWSMLTGPSKYRHPDWSPGIQQAWNEWRWPTLMIGGNHEPFHLFRGKTDPLWGGKLHYRDAGEFPPILDGLRVLGLSGIWPADRAEEFNTSLGWPEAVREVRANRLSRKSLAYYRNHEVDSLLECAPNPHILLLHDWPVCPPKLKDEFSKWDQDITAMISLLKPAWIFCGHHHRYDRFSIQESHVMALNIISHQETVFCPINRGWAALADWEGTELSNVRFWPAVD